MPDDPRIVRFGVFEADLAAGALRRNGARVKLQEQPFQVLAALLEKPGEIVAKDELQRRIWNGDTFVDFDRSLATAVNKIRQALGDSATRPRFVETVPKKGYRFIGTSGPQPAAHEAAGPQPRRGLFISAALGILLVTAGAVAYVASREPAAPPTPIVTPLTHFPGNEDSPSFSPDESQIVFTWDGGNPGGQTDIYSMVVGTAVPQPLTQTDVVELAPTWSPDGKWIAFARARDESFLVKEWPIRERNADLMLMPAGGGPAVRLADLLVTDDFLVGFAWTPDSSKILFTEAVDQKPAGIAAVDVSSHRVQSMTKPPDGFNAGDSRPSLSADGRTLVFWRGYRYSGDLYTVDLDERSHPRGIPQRLTSELLFRGHTSFYPGGDAILYSSFGQLRRLSLRAPAAATALPWAASYVGASAVSESGALLAFVERRNDSNLWQGLLSDEVKLIGDLEPLHHSTYNEGFPKYSPDGSFIAFQSNRSGAMEVWIGDSDRTGVRQLTQFGAHSGSPRISPDGTRVAFDSNESGAWRIYVTGVEGGALERVPVPVAHAVKPEWSPDGQWIYFCAVDETEGSGIFKARPDGSGIRPILKARGPNCSEGLAGRPVDLLLARRLYPASPRRRGRLGARCRLLHRGRSHRTGRLFRPPRSRAGRSPDFAEARARGRCARYGRRRTRE